jgi:bifunctional UDP-N-acetylglucosamine pyrophosphorylase/glucosamine-1-phosphate N-acetyltransferase
MKAIILAAGEGKRMRPLTLTTPKPLLKINGQTILDNIFDSLPEAIDEVIVVVKYLAPKIKEYLGDFYKGRKIKYVEGSERGNAIGFLACRSYFKEGERFLVLYGDEIQSPEEIKKCLSYRAAWVCVPTDNPKSAGIADIAEDGRILEVVEKPENPKSNWSAAGTIVLDTKIFNYAPRPHASGESYLSSMVDQFLKDYPVYAVFGKKRPPLTSIEDVDRIT